MPDKFTETSTQSYLSRILNSFVGVLVGFLCIFISIFCLYLNEGRTDLSRVAKTAIEISSTSANTDQAHKGKLISTTGVFKSDETIGDTLFLNPGNYIAIQRIVEMYAWVEHQQQESHKNLGGSKTTQTTYTYEKQWTGNPSSSFKYQEGHENPSKQISDAIIKARNAELGVYHIDMNSVELPPFQVLPLTSSNIMPKNGATLSNNYLFVSKSAGSTLDNPQLGDLRIHYKVLRSGNDATIFGALNGDNISAYYDSHNNKLYRVFNGTRDSALSTLHTEYVSSLWMLRLIGFIFMFIGLFCILAPIAVFLDIIPFLGSLTSVMILIIVAPIALIATVTIILISKVLHSFIALLIAAVIILAALITFALRFFKQQKTE